MSPGRGSRSIAGVGGAGFAEQPFDRGHRPDQARCAVVRQFREHRCNFVMHAAVEFCECLTSLGGQCEPVLPPVGRQRLAGDQSAFIEILHDPAEIAGIETQFGADLLGREILAVSELVQHPRFAQREGALQELLVQHAELAGVEAVEGADRRDFLFGIQLGHGITSILAIVKYIVAFGKYILMARHRPGTPGPVLLCMGLFSIFCVWACGPP